MKTHKLTAEIQGMGMRALAPSSTLILKCTDHDVFSSLFFVVRAKTAHFINSLDKSRCSVNILTFILRSRFVCCFWK